MKKFTLGIYFALILIGLMGVAFWYLASIHVLQYVVYGTLAALAIVVLLLLWWLFSRIGESGARRELHRKQLLAEVARQEREDKLADVEAEARRTTAEAQKMRAQAELTARNAEYLAARAQAQDLSNRSALYLHERQTALGRGLHFPSEAGHYPLHYQVTEDGLPVVTYPMMLARGQVQRQIEAPAEAPDQRQEEDQAAPKPLVVPSGRELLMTGAVERTLNEGKLILGVDLQGQPVYLSIKKCFTTLVSGLPATGKTTTVFWIVAQLVLIGARLWVVDPHLFFEDEDGARSLGAELAELADSFVFDPCEGS